MGIFKKRRRRKTNRSKPRLRSYQRRLAIEQLEERALLAWLTVIAHGQAPHEQLEWMKDTAEAIYSGITNQDVKDVDADDLPLAELRISNVETDTETDIKNWANLASSELAQEADGTENSFMLVDWADLAPRYTHGAGNADEVGARLGLVVGHVITELSIDDVHFVGFSRGSYVVNTAIGILTGQSVEGPLKWATAHTKALVSNVLGDSTFEWRPANNVTLTTLDHQANLDDGVIKRYSNISYWENYYQRESHVLLTTLSQGGPISGATHNVDITDTEFLQSRATGFGDVNAHPAVHEWYTEVVPGNKGFSIEHWRKARIDGSYLLAPTPSFHPAFTFSSPNDFPYTVLLPALGQVGAAPPSKAYVTGKVLGSIDDGNGSANSDDHDDTAIGATALVLPSSRSVTTPGAIQSAGETDWFRVTAVRDGLLKVETGAGVIGSSLRSEVRVFDANLSPIASDASFGDGLAAQVFVNASAQQTYYIRVAGVGSSIGSYLLLVSQPDGVAPPDPHANTSPADDYGDTKSSALPVSWNGDEIASVDGQIGRVGDDDWFLVTAPMDGDLTFEISTPSGSNLDTHLRLHNSEVLLAQDDQQITRPVTAGERLWLHVRAGSENGPGDISPGKSSTGQYVLILTLSNASQGDQGPLDCGNLIGKKITLDPNGDGTSNGSIDDPADVRWFQIDGTQAGYMEVTIHPVNDDLKPFVTAYRSDGSGIDTDTGEFDSEARVVFDVEADECIIVAVRSHNSRSTGGFTIDIAQPDNPPDDDVHDFGESPRDLDSAIDDHGNGAFGARIETPDDNDWYTFALEGEGYVHVEVETQDGTLVPYLELNRDGTSGGFFETDDGRDGRAHVAFLPSAETALNNLFVKVSALDGTQGSYTLRVWRSANKDDDHPDSGGQFAYAHDLEADGMVIIRGRIEHPGDNDAFRVEPTTPGPVAIQVISLTEGFTPFLRESWSPADSLGDTQNTDGGSGRGGRTFHVIDSDVTHVNIDVSSGGIQPLGDYVVYVWQPETPADIDPDTIGIEASPIMLDGTGNGSLPGEPNGTEPAPALNHAGDKDVFQVRAASDRPITFTVSGQDTFLRVYDGSGRAIATDRNSGPSGESRITLDANRGDLYYLEVTAFNGTDTGTYSINVSQPTDDHPDVPIFQPKESQTNDATVITLDGNGFGQSTGAIDVDYVEVPDDRDLDGTYDDFENASLDRQLWRTIQSGDAAAEVENGVASLTAVAGSSATTDGKSVLETRGYVTGDVSFDLSVQLGPANNSARVELANASSSIGVNLMLTAGGTVQATVAGAGYTELESLGPQSIDQSTTYQVQFNQTVDGIEVLLDGTRLGLFEGSLAAESVLRATANAEAVPAYDDFDDNSIDTDKWNVTGEVREENGSLVVVAREGGVGYDSTANTDGKTTGFPAGAPIHGFRTDFNFESGNETQWTGGRMRFRMAAGGNSLLFEYNSNAGQMQVIASGLYGSGVVAVLPSKSGTAEVRQHGTDVEILYNDSVVYTVSNVTIPDSFFEVRTDAAGGSSDKAVVIDNLHFYPAETPLARVDIDNVAGQFHFATKLEEASFGDHDMFQVHATERGQFTIDVDTTDDRLDTFLRVYDSRGKLVAINDDGGDGRNSTVTFNTFMDETYLVEVSGYGDNSVGAYQVQVQSSPPPALEKLGVFDDFNSGFDTAKWSLEYTGSADHTNLNVSGGKVTLEADGRGAPDDTTAVNLASRAYVEDGVSFDLSGEFGDYYNFGYAEVTNGNDFIRVQLSRYINDGSNVVAIGASGYTTLENNAPHDTTTVSFTENTTYNFRIENVGDEIHVFMDNTLLARFAGNIADGSYFQAHAHAAQESTRYAFLTLDNVEGTFYSNEAVPVSYDTFDGAGLDYDKWHVAGDVRLENGALTLPLFQNFQPVQGYVTTAGIAGRTNLRGFKLNFGRTTEPKNLGDWDIYTRLELTNGEDFIRIGNLHNQTFFVQTGGSYGNQTINLSVPSDQVPDGPFEVRERDGNIEVLHNNNVKLTIANQTVRAGSYFVFQTHGNPFGESTHDEPENFEAAIDNLEFYYDAAPNELTVAPALKQESDTGSSNTDHVTNQLSLDFEWAEGPAGTQYQWREGELLGDGTIAHSGDWSDVQSETTAHIDFPHASVHVFSVRTVDTDGIVGDPSSRAVVIDVQGPSVTQSAPASVLGNLDSITLTFDEPIDPETFTANDIVSFTGPSGVDLSDQVVGISGSGTQFTIELNSQTTSGIYEIVLGPEIQDIAGNALDQDSDGVAGEAVEDQFSASIQLLPALLSGMTRTDEATAVDGWNTVTLGHAYQSMVVVATPNYAGGDPGVVRIRNAVGDSFEIQVVTPDGGILSGIDVDYMVVEEGSYTEAEHGIKLEAVKFTSSTTDRKGSWIGEQQDYVNSYTNPVVFGQVMTANDPNWSVFWSRGSSRTEPATASELYVGKHVGEDNSLPSASEEIGYIVFESGTGSIGNLSYEVALGGDIVRGTSNGPPFAYSHSLSSPTSAIVTQAAMDGGDGSWALLYGTNAVGAGGINVAVDEDQIGDSERRHTTEQLSYIVFEEITPSNKSPTADAGGPYSGIEGSAIAFDGSGSFDADGSIESYQWDFGDGSTASGPQANHTYLDNGGYEVTLTVTDNQGATGTDSANVMVSNVNNDPTGVPTITGLAQEDEVLTANTNDISDDDGISGAFSYQWLRNGVAVDGATSDTYELDDDDVGASISVQVTYTDNQGTPEGPLTSAATAPVANVNDDPVGVPTISGAANEDETLTATTNSISDADGVGAFTIQWLRNSVPIDGATSSAYTLGSDDVGTKISVQVSYTDGQGTAEGPLTSAETATVTGASSAGGPALLSGMTRTDESTAVDGWNTVTLGHAYQSMVVVATPNYAGGDPGVVRIRNAEGNSFEFQVVTPDGGTIGGVDVDYMVVEEGSYTEAEHGIKLEAVKFNSSTTDRKGSWIGEQQDYVNSYTNPVVFGQVMTANDPNWSVFWSRGSSRTEPATASELYVGKHVGEDNSLPSASEEIGYIVFESGTGSIGNLSYEVGLGGDIVRGTSNGPPFAYNHSLSSPTSAIVTQAAMDGGDGSWALLYGAGAVGPGGINVAVDEDQIGDSERRHTTEQLSYIVFEEITTSNKSPTADAGGPYSGIEGSAIAFDGSGSFDSDGTIESYQWDFGDGSTANGPTPSHVFINEDTYTVTLTVTDDDGAVVADELDVAVSDSDPTASFVSSTSNPTVGQNVSFTDTSVSYDGIVSWTWDFDGDGSTDSTLQNPVYAFDVAGSYSVQLTVTEADNDAHSFVDTIEVSDAATSAPHLVYGQASSEDNSWTTVSLSSYTSHVYEDMVVVATPLYASPTQFQNTPVVVRVRNVTGTSFEFQTTDVGSGNYVAGVPVYFVTVEAGVYNQAEHGITMEAGTFLSTVTNAKGSWAGQEVDYQQAYTSPVVFGQVMTANDPNWSSFWASGDSRTSPPTSSSLRIGKMVGEDPNSSRADEMLGYIVFEDNQSGDLGGVDFEVGLGDDVVRGFDNTSTGYDYSHGVSNASAAILSQAGMDGGDGSWAVLYGNEAITSDNIRMAADEDNLNDTERRHTTEQFAYFVLGGSPSSASPLMAKDPIGAASPTSKQVLTTADIDPLVDDAIAAWTAVGISDSQIARLRDLQFGIADLTGASLGQQAGNMIVLDINAAGYGWFIDPTPWDDSEFRSGSGPSNPDSQLGMDLLTVIYHEMGHSLGLDDDYSDPDSDNIMNGWLPTDTRRKPTDEDLDRLFASDSALDEVMR